MKNIIVFSLLIKRSVANYKLIFLRLKHEKKILKHSFANAARPDAEVAFIT